MKTENKDLARIRSFDEIRLSKARIKYELAYQEKMMFHDLYSLGETVKNSFLFSLREMAQDATTLLATRLVQWLRKEKDDPDRED